LIANLKDRFLTSTPFWPVVAALAVGLLSGAGVWLFKLLIVWINKLAHQWVSASWLVIFIPVVGGLAVGLLMFFLVGDERYHGVAGIIESVALAGGRLRYLRMPVKTLASAISIGSGASVGPEDPSVQIGANIGSFFGQRLHLSDDQVRTLVAAGSAGGIAAAFNAPIAGVFFALEVVMGEISASAFGWIVVSAVTSSVFTQAVSGSKPAFSVPAYEFQDPWELFLYLGLGLLAGLISVVYIRLLYGMQDILHKWKIPRWLKPAAAGLVVGVVGLYLPQVLGVGYTTIEQILNGQLVAVGLLLALLVAKLFLTTLCIGAGFMGGLFAPALFLGATLGSAYGTLVLPIFYGLPGEAPAYAMVGMAALLAGAVHAPLTAILLLFEMTNDYRIILPLMFAVGVSLAVSRGLQRDSIYMLGLARKGIRLDRGRDVEVLQAITVGEVMHKEVMTIPGSTTLDIAADLLARTRHHGLPVVDERGDLFGIFTTQDLDKAQTEGGSIQTVAQACTRELTVTYPNETIGEALRRMSHKDLGRLPVVRRENPRQLVGILRRADVIRAYDIALARRASARHSAKQVRLDALSPESVEVLQAIVEKGSVCDGRMMNEILWPQDSLIATLQRGRESIIPHGDTVLEAGDVLVFVAEGEAREQVLQLCRALETR
jgi:chloride channel protein, CIC family